MCAQGQMEGHGNGKPVGTSAVKVLARLSARNAIKQQLRDQGVRVTLVPVHEIEEKAKEYLANHPELYVQARERARKMGWVDEQQHVLVTPDWWGNRRPVTQTDNAKMATENTSELVQPKGD